MLRLRISITVLTILALISVCLSAQAKTTTHEERQLALNTLVVADNNFGFDLYSRLTQQNPSANTFISPASIAIALQMTYNGSAGETRAAMAQAMRLDKLTMEQVAQANSTLLASLRTKASGTTLDMANAIWANKDIKLKPDFLSINREFYKSELGTLDFSSPRSLGVINAWVKKNTRGKIDSIVDSLDPATALFLANAVYLKGKWESQFKKSQTADRTFTCQDGKKVILPFMRGVDCYRYYEDSNLQMAELPYQGKKMSMFLFLPSKNTSLQELTSSLNSEKWHKLMAEREYENGLIILPRFNLEYEAKQELKTALADIGLESIFSSGADFSRMSPITAHTPIFIKEVAHKAVVEVNEEGTEAAAIMMMLTMPMGPGGNPAPFEMILDHPFFFAIRDNKTGLILFMGSVMKP